MRRCACNCGQPLPPDARENRRYLDNNHRQRAYRRKVVERAAQNGVPASVSLRVLGATQGRNGDGRTARRATREPELRLSYRRAVAVIVPYLPDAEELLRAALPPRQREHLERGGSDPMPGQLEIAA